MNRGGQRKRLAAVPMVAIAVVVAVIASATPATAATGSGAGTGVWTYNGRGTSSNPPCAVFETTTKPSATYSGQDVGTYSSPDGATYAGPVRLSVTVTERFYGNPTGDLYTDPSCTELRVPPTIPIASGSSAGSFSAAGYSGSVNCTYSSGSYTRVANVATVILNGSCTISTTVVVGGTTVKRTSTTPTSEVRTHELYACSPPGSGPPSSCSDANQFVAEPVRVV